MTFFSRYTIHHRRLKAMLCSSSSCHNGVLLVSQFLQIHIMVFKWGGSNSLAIPVSHSKTRSPHRSLQFTGTGVNPRLRRNITWIENKVSRGRRSASRPRCEPDERSHSALCRLKIGRKLGDTHLARLMYHSDSGAALIRRRWWRG